MKKLFFAAAACLILAACSNGGGNVSIQLPDDFTEQTLVVSHVMLDNMFKAKQADDVKVIYDTLEVKNGVASLKLDPEGAAWYNITPPVMTVEQPEFFASPGDNLEVKIACFDPLECEVSGSELMDDMTALEKVSNPIMKEYTKLVRGDDEISSEQMNAIMDRYDDAVKKFVTDHPDSPVVPFAITRLSGDDFKSFYDNMSPKAKQSILMPYAESFNKQVEDMLDERAAEEARKEEVASGKITAPDFTLPDLDGKKVSLSDFRGKWVVLDFWGSWCGWCVKGFPALKEAYKKYGDKIVVIGIDCNESEEDWREGVKRHQLPWLNLYNGHDTKLYTDYKIEGFPTKAIINPEGKLVDLTTGEDPSFFERLAAFVE